MGVYMRKPRKPESKPKPELRFAHVSLAEIAEKLLSASLPKAR